MTQIPQVRLNAPCTPMRGYYAAGAALLFFGFSAGHLAAAEQDKQALIESALSAAPPMVAEAATVKDMKGNVLKEGSGAYTCFPREGTGESPMCVEKAWEAWVDAFMHSKPFTAPGVGIAYMLAGDAPDAGASNIDPAAKQPTADNQWVVEGPHIMIIVPDPAQLEAFPAEPTSGEPYVMWMGTPYAHIMVPAGPRPEQRTVAQK